jgi:hypothetical protein
LIHENLDTSFVNLAALIRYLRRRQFVGNIRVELSGYEADVILTAENNLKVIEHDCIAGRISEGEDALQRLLIRAREPGGIVHVYQKIEETVDAGTTAAIPTILPEDFELSVEQKLAAKAKTSFVEKVARPPHLNGDSKIEPQTVDNTLLKSKPSLLKVPFELDNDFETKVRQTTFAPSDWQTLLNLTAELLRTVDKLLVEANLDFLSAFEKARAEIADDYPFLNPAADVFSYRDGKLFVREQINAKFFAASINEILRRMLEKLGRNPKFSNIHRIVTEKIRALVEERKPLYDKFSITPSLEKIVRER